MGVTRFPNGVTGLGDVAVQHGTASITGVGTVTSSLDTVTGVVCSAGAALGTATTQIMGVAGTAHVNATGAATFIIRTYQGPTGAAGTVATSISYAVFGTKA